MESRLYAPSQAQVAGTTAVHVDLARVDLLPVTPSAYGTWEHRGIHAESQQGWQWDGGGWYPYQWTHPLATTQAFAQVAVPPGPQISALDPPSGVTTASVTIHGQHFGSGGTVQFGSTAASVGTWTDTVITTTVPAGLTTGTVSVSVHANGARSDGVAFTVVSGAVLSTLQPTFGPAGHPVTIAGVNFGSSPTGNTVTFNGTAVAAADVTHWSSTSISVRVPAGATTGNVMVTVGGQPSNGLYFTVGTEEVQYYVIDAVGSVRLVTRANQTVAARYDYLPFGQPWRAGSGATETRRFAGLERSPETGAGSWLALDYAGARYHHSQTGRLASPDPLLLADSFVDPQLWNRYSYALGAIR